MTGRNITLMGGTIAAAFLAALVLLTAPALAQSARPLPPAGATAGRIATSLGEQWVIDACAGDRFTVTVASEAFTPFLSVYTDTAGAPLVEAASEDRAQAQALVEAEAGERYIVEAAGERRSDRGDYTIGADFGDSALAGLAFDGALAAGADVTGTVRSSAGEVWIFRGCAGAVVTATATSAAFTPYLELFDPATEETLAESSAVDDTLARIEGVELPATGVYALIVAGERRNDRGAYTLSLNPGEDALRPSPLTSAAPTRQANATATLRAEMLCTVRANPNLNVRSGPGTEFAPTTMVRFNTQLRPLARNLDATWIEIQALPSGPRGWVSSGAQFVTCTFDLTTLPVGVLPPTPTPRPTATFTPVPTLPPVVVLPPTPTLPPVVVLPGGGPGGDEWRGAMLTGFDIARIGGSNATFRSRIYFRAEIDGTPGGRRIDRVEFRIQDDFGDEFYARTERTYGYCAFGGGEPNCNVIDIDRGARWPDTDREFCNGDYTVFADVFLDNGDFETWNSPFTIDHPDLPNCGDEGVQPASDLVAYIAQSGPGDASSTAYGALVFQVVAFDPDRGDQDGDGIDSVDLRIFDVDGSEVYQRTEGNAAYCAFAGGEPDCNVWYFGDNGDAWPSGEPVRYYDPYSLRGRVNAEDGRTLEVEMTVYIEP
jgi:hypothetical protein